MKKFSSGIQLQEEYLGRQTDGTVENALSCLQYFKTFLLIENLKFT
jgi:hypothetical protein